MNYKKNYVLFQFQYIGDGSEYDNFCIEEIRAIRFKYPEGMDIDKEIKVYARTYAKEWRDKTFKDVRPDDYEKFGVDETYDFLKDFLLKCRIDYEDITKEEYKSWKEMNKAGKITWL